MTKITMKILQISLQSLNKKREKILLHVFMIIYIGLEIQILITLWRLV